MARIRTIKPSFFESEDVAVLPLRARLLWIGLWTHCDDEGRTKDHPKLIKARIWPLDPVTLKDIEEDLAILDGHGRIVRYEVDGQRYLEITNWRDHQSINKPTPSKFPPPPKDARNSRRTPVALPEDSLQEGKGKEGKGRDARAREPEPSPTEPPEQPPPPKPREATPPPDRCARHLDDPDPPNCGPCGSARKARERWDTDQAAEAEHQRKQAALAQSTKARQRAQAERAAIDNCH